MGLNALHLNTASWKLLSLVGHVKENITKKLIQVMSGAVCVVSGIALDFAKVSSDKFAYTWDADLLEGGHIQQQNWSCGPDFHLTISLTWEVSIFKY